MRPQRLAPVFLVAAGLLTAAVGLATIARAQAVRAPAPPPVQPVPTVDLDRYAGRWYEIARFPNQFQKDCTGNVVVYYSRRDDGRIDVRNTCDTADGMIEAKGVARRADKDGPASILEVRFAPAILSFLPAVWGDYWILDLAPDYSTAVVGSPDREHLWFLSRTPAVDQATWARLVEAARSQGFGTDLIVRTAQDGTE